MEPNEFLEKVNDNKQKILDIASKISNRSEDIDISGHFMPKEVVPIDHVTGMAMKHFCSNHLELTSKGVGSEKIVYKLSEEYVLKIHEPYISSSDVPPSMERYYEVKQEYESWILENEQDCPEMSFSIQKNIQTTLDVLQHKWKEKFFMTFCDFKIFSSIGNSFSSDEKKDELLYKIENNERLSKLLDMISKWEIDFRIQNIGFDRERERFMIFDV